MGSASEGFEHDCLIEGKDIAAFSIQEDRVNSGPTAILGGKGFRVAEFASIFEGATDFACSRAWRSVDGGIGSQACEKVTAVAKSFAKPFPQAVVSEPAVANDKDVFVGELGTNIGNHVSSLFYFGLKLDESFSYQKRLNFKIHFQMVEPGR